MRRFLSRMFTIVVVVYGLLIIAILGLRLTINNDWPPLGMAIGLLHLLVLPALVLLPLCLLLRRWRLALLLVPAVLTFSLSYGQLFIGGAAAVPDAAPRLRVLTFNIQNEVEDLDWLIDIIRDSDADVIALQELSLQAAERLSSDLSEAYPNQALHAGLDIPRYAGNGVISRLPISLDEYWRNTELTEYTLGHQRVVLELDGTPVTLFNTHPYASYSPEWGMHFEDHTLEVNAMLERANTMQGAVIIVGDFNMTDQFEEYGRITQRYTDTFREVGSGFGFTYPSLRLLPLKIWRLDYVFHSAEFVGVEARVWPESGNADHSPLYAELALVG